MSTENKQFTEKEAPQGYWVDAKGVLTPESLIKDIDRARDSLVQEVIGRAIELNKALAEFKLSGFSDIGAFVDLSANEYGVSLGGKKGNVTLYSFDGALLNKWILCCGTMKTVVSDNIKSMRYMLAYDGVLSGISVFYQNSADKTE